jgi:hypothetical protein
MNHFQNPIDVVQYVVVPEADHVESQGFQKGRPFCIVMDMRCVLPAVDFDDTFLLETDKVHYVQAENVLAAELESGTVAVSQMPPQFSFRVRLVPAQVLSEAPCVSLHTPHPALSPGRGEGDIVKTFG